jgi:hypothetical protein
MTGRFETLIYTDCRPRQGLRGTAGLQFQARSSDGVAAAEMMVKDNLLYEPPSRWMADRRPVEQYPPSFAHMWATGHLATASGVYLGREANGTREGNQLTHAIVTTDPADYLGLRPAQLYGAGFWSTVPALTTRSDPVELAPGAGEYSPARARDFVLAQPDGPATLLALVSALGEAGRSGQRRVLFVGDDAATIVEWLVAGTLLVPRERAFMLGFKIFSTDPARCSLPIVAVPTEFAGAAGRIDNQLGYVVFDVGRHEHTAVPPTPAAVRWVPLFLREDPRDVVDALDVAAESGIADGEAAAALGLAAILHRTPDLRDAEPIVRWLRTGPERLRQAYGLDIAELFAETPERWPRRVLVLLDAVGCDGLLPGKAADVRLALIISEVDAARSEAVVTDDPLPALPSDEWQPDHAEQVRLIVIEALGSVTSDVAYEALLRVAYRFEAGVGVADVVDTADPFIRYWADHPEEKFQPDLWPCHDELVARLLNELTRRVATGSEQQAVVGDRWGGWLLPRLGRLERPLAAAALGAAVRRGEGRDGLVKKYLAAAGSDPHEFGWVVDALWSQSRPSILELRLVRDLAPDGTTLPPRLFEPLVELVTRAAVLDIDVLNLCRSVIRRHLMQPSQAVYQVLDDDDRLTATIDQLTSKDKPSDERVDALLVDLAKLPSRAVEARTAELVDGLLRVVAFGTMNDLLKQHEALLDPYLRRLRAVLAEQLSERHVSVAFYLAADRTVLDGRQREKLREGLWNWMVRASDREIRAAGRRVATLGTRWRDAWEDDIDRLAGRRRRYRLVHPFGGR